MFRPQHFEPATEDLAGVQWSPDGRVMCVWESMLQVSHVVCVCLRTAAS